MKFTVVLHTDDGLRYGVQVPDLPGCFSGGDDLDDALASVQEAIDLHVEGLLEEGQPLPQRLPIAQHQANAAFAGGIWAVVDVPVEKYLGDDVRVLEHADFRIGLEFFTEAGRWRCTDVGSRTICAAKLDEYPPDWYNGPPYAVAEFVFDENDFGALYRAAGDVPQ